MAYLLRLFLVCCLWFVGMTLLLNSPSLAGSSLNSSDVFKIAVESLEGGNYQQALQDLTTVINFQDDLKGVAYSDRCLANLQLHRILIWVVLPINSIKLKLRSLILIKLLN